MKKALVAVLVVGLLGAGGYGAYQHFFADKEEEQERVSSTSEDAVYVDLVSQIAGLGSGNGLIERFGGEVEPQATLEVKLENERTVKKCFVKEGDRVKEGQKLFVYDTQEAEDKLAQAQIDIERAQGDIELSKQTISQLEKDKNEASADDKLVISTQILEAQNSIKRSEYEIKSNELTISQLEEDIKNATVTAEMGGLVQKISDPNSSDSYGYGGDSGNVYMTILADGEFRIKGTVNEQNYQQIQASVGMPMIVYSRVDSSKTWSGMISEVKDSADEQSEDGYSSYMMGDEAGSSNYSFYVELDSSEGLMLGQHVYMELDAGQNDVKEGLWIDDYYIIQEDDQAYVWMANKENLIEKHAVTLGEYDDELFKYEIVDGLQEDDYIAYPLDTISEGDPVIYNDMSDMDAGMSMDGMIDEGSYEEMPAEDGVDLSMEPDMAAGDGEVYEDGAVYDADAGVYEE
ncbi:MAG: efflux RND transporter periplasmic adaptor subunit [Lachnospiraceae bacterium]|uniref:efflux RND transporter periplasmic adaptor subunit n=1 Tax=Parablautia sp. Marseille-Q6255 TaxID=3039593 RepID=UPI0024BCA0A5|nr:efflux RND transporter periplasmic adaptor subunit [Parablautia sp. Marseille-Q6255]